MIVVNILRKKKEKVDFTREKNNCIGFLSFSLFNIDSNVSFKISNGFIKIFCWHNLWFDKDIVNQSLLDLFCKSELKENGRNEHKLAYYFDENTWLDEWCCQHILELKYSKWS